MTWWDARRLLAITGRSHVPLHRGAGFFARDPRPTAASRFLAETIAASPGELTVLALGPLTNLHAALTARPELAREIGRLVVMGGRSTSGLSEFNFRGDPTAADAVLTAGIPTVVIPFDLVFGVAVTPALVARLAAAEGSVVSRVAWRLAVFARIQDLFRRLKGRTPGQATGGFHPWDVVAAAWLVKPDLFGAVREVVHRVDDAGRSTLTPWSGDGPRVSMPGTLDADGLLSLFLERVSRPRAVSRR